MGKIIPWVLVVLLAVVAYAGWQRPASTSIAHPAVSPAAAPVAATPVEPSAPIPTTEPDISHCKTYHKLADAIMRNRQVGVPMVDMMELDGDPSEITKRLVVLAYEHPRMSVEANQDRVVTDFANEVYLECVKAAE